MHDDDGGRPPWIRAGEILVPAPQIHDLLAILVDAHRPPISLRVRKFCSNASRTAAKAGSHVPSIGTDRSFIWRPNLPRQPLSARLHRPQSAKAPALPTVGPPAALYVAHD